MGFDDTRAWYGGGYVSDEPIRPQPPVSRITGNGVSSRDWAMAVNGPMRTPQLKGDGLILGRFSPVHRGHAHLVHEALKSITGRVNLVVSAHDGDPLDGHHRAAAARALEPRDRINVALVAKNIGTRGAPTGDDFWRPWVEWIKKERLLSNCRFLISADPNAERLATLLQLTFVEVERDPRFASGTTIRSAPWRYWDEIHPMMREGYCASIALVGPEGAGKTTLAEQLRAHYGTSLAQEYLPAFLQWKGAETPTWQDLVDEVWAGQVGAWNRARQAGHRVCFLDTEQLTLQLWGERLHGPTATKLYPRQPTLTLLLDDAGPWLGAAERDEPEQRRRFVARFEEELTARKWDWRKISGPRETRFAQAVERIDAWIAANPLNGAAASS